MCEAATGGVEKTVFNIWSMVLSWLATFKALIMISPGARTCEEPCGEVVIVGLWPCKSAYLLLANSSIG